MPQGGAIRASLKRCAAVYLTVFTASILAQGGRPIEFNIPSQGLTSALETLARQAALQLLYDPDALPEREAPALAGSYTVREAMERLLRGTGLRYTFTAENAVAVKSAEANTSSGQAKDPVEPKTGPISIL